MAFLLLIVLMVACLPLDWPLPWLPLTDWGSLLATLAVVGGTWLLAAGTSLALIVYLRRAPHDHARVLRVYVSWRSLHAWLLISSFVGCLVFLGWGWSVRQLCQISLQGRSLVAPGAELILLLPYGLMCLGSWLSFYELEQALLQASRGALPGGLSRGQYLLFQARQQSLLFMLPLGVLITQQSVVRLAPGWADAAWFPVGMLAGLCGLLLILPLLLRPLLGWRSIPDGPVRQRLGEHAMHLGVRYRDLLCWDTHGMMANALVLGVIPRWRYLVFTDRLLAQLSAAELDAVLGHELGHIKYRHFLFYLSFFLLSVLVISMAWACTLPWWADLEIAWLQRHPDWLGVLPLVSIGLYIFVVFGFFSRRCERQADLYGCQLISQLSEAPPKPGQDFSPQGIGVFIRALRRVQQLNGGGDSEGRRRGNRLVRWMDGLQAWQHATIAQRIAFLERVAADPGVAGRFQRRFRWLQCSTLVGLAGLLSGMLWWHGWEPLLQAI